MQPLFIGAYSKGLQNNQKPWLTPDDAFFKLENAYTWRERIKKREGLRLLGRLTRGFTGLVLGNFNGAAPPVFNANLFAVAGVTEPDATIVPGSISITSLLWTWTDENQDSILITTDTSPVGYNDVILDVTPNGVNTDITIGIGVPAYNVGDRVYISGIATGSTTELNGNYYNVVSNTPFVITIDVDSSGFTPYVPASGGRIRNANGTINYITSDITLTANAGFAGAAVTGGFKYNPNLPVMGIWQRERSLINDEQTIFWDTTYAYNFIAGQFQEFIPGTTWNGTDADFFWATNWTSSAQTRILFATNFINDANNPIRYTDGSTWTDFYPLIDSTHRLSQARILIPYYGRLVALNVWESPDNAGVPNFGAGINYFNRCRFSQVGDPTQVDAWRQDIFGKGGFIDAPTGESIVSATFYKNTLIVFFEKSTWQLRYVGDYGIPFIWERISSDFGSESTFSTVLFDRGILTVGDRAIVSSDAITVDRIDLVIPDLVFEILNENAGIQRVNGVRNFQKEIVYWSFPDQNSLEEGQYFPNKVLVLNYRNNTYAIFRDNVTCFGTYQSDTGVDWNSTNIFWDDPNVLWDDVDDQSLFPSIVSGNQVGFVHYYANQLPDDPSLFIQNIDLSTTPITLTVPNHNLQTVDIVYITGLIFEDASTDLNEEIYSVRFIDTDTIEILKWDTADQGYIENFPFTPTPGTTYLGGGLITLFPRLHVETKDFNPYQKTGGQAKLCYIDFLMDVPYDDDGTELLNGAMTVELLANSSPAVVGNLLVGNTNVATSATLPYYVPAAEYAWHRFYATLAAQYIRVIMTYNDDIMNDIDTHSQPWVLNAMTLWVRQGGKIIF